jgi:hypothetical protein
MANKKRGFITFKGGDKKQYKLKYDFNALCEMEDALGVDSIFETFQQGFNVSAKNIRILIWAGLIHEHEDLTIKDVGRILTGVDLKEVYAAVAEALNAILGENDGEEVGE